MNLCGCFSYNISNINKYEQLARYTSFNHMRETHVFHEETLKGKTSSSWNVNGFVSSTSLLSEHQLKEAATPICKQLLVESTYSHYNPAPTG